MEKEESDANVLWPGEKVKKEVEKEVADANVLTVVRSRR